MSHVEAAQCGIADCQRTAVGESARHHGNDGGTTPRIAHRTAVIRHVTLCVCVCVCVWRRQTLLHDAHTLCVGRKQTLIALVQMSHGRLRSCPVLLTPTPPR